MKLFNFIRGISFIYSVTIYTIVLPYFKLNFNNGEYVYMFTMGWMMVGRLIGGAVHYRLKIPVDKKYFVAFIVYVLIALIDGTVL